MKITMKIMVMSHEDYYGDVNDYSGRDDYNEGVGNDGRGGSDEDEVDNEGSDDERDGEEEPIKHWSESKALKSKGQRVCGSPVSLLLNSHNIPDWSVCLP